MWMEQPRVRVYREEIQNETWILQYLGQRQDEELAMQTKKGEPPEAAKTQKGRMS